jgi:hypothetical protein
LDTYWAGSPTATTWIAGRKDRNLGNLQLPFASRYLNPIIGGTEPANELRDMGDFDQDAFNERPAGGAYVSGSNDFVNRPIVVMASSNSLGSENPVLQPALLFLSDLGGSEFRYCRPQLINVHLGLTDTTADQKFLWH